MSDQGKWYAVEVRCKRCKGLGYRSRMNEVSYGVYSGKRAQCKRCNGKGSVSSQMRIVGPIDAVGNLLTTSKEHDDDRVGLSS